MRTRCFRGQSYSTSGHFEFPKLLPFPTPSWMAKETIPECGKAGHRDAYMLQSYKVSSPGLSISQQKWIIFQNVSRQRLVRRWWCIYRSKAPCSFLREACLIVWCQFRKPYHETYRLYNPTLTDSRFSINLICKRFHRCISARESRQTLCSKQQSTFEIPQNRTPQIFWWICTARYFYSRKTQSWQLIFHAQSVWYESSYLS